MLSWTFCFFFCAILFLSFIVLCLALSFISNPIMFFPWSSICCRMLIIMYRSSLYTVQVYISASDGSSFFLVLSFCVFFFVSFLVCLRIFCVLAGLPRSCNSCKILHSCNFCKKILHSCNSCKNVLQFLHFCVVAGIIQLILLMIEKNSTFFTT